MEYFRCLKCLCLNVDLWLCYFGGDWDIFRVIGLVYVSGRESLFLLMRRRRVWGWREGICRKV